MWRARKTVLLVSLGYSESNFQKHGSGRWPNIWWARPQPGDPDFAGTPTNRLVHEFLAREFTRKVPYGREWQYKVSVAVAETFLKAPPVLGQDFSQGGIGGLLYPSIATDANDDNLALKCDVADESLEFAWVHYVEVSKPTSEADTYEWKGLDFADTISESGEIQWRGKFPNVLVPGTDFRLDYQEGDLVIKDSLNTVAGKFK